MANFLITISHGHGADLLRNFPKVAAHFGKNFVVVDNLGEFQVESFCIAHGCSYISNSKQKGFGENNNFACDYISRNFEPNFFVLINPDVEISSFELEKFLFELERSGSNWGTIEMKNGVDATNMRKFPNPFSQAGRFLGLVREKNKIDATDKFWISGSFLAIEAKAFHLAGGFDERFFLYFEDVDFCRHLWSIAGSPYIGSQTARHVGRYDNRKIFKRNFWQFMMSMFRYYAKWGFK